ILNALISSLTIYLLFVFVEKKLGRSAAQISCLIYGFHPITILVSVLLFTDSLFILFTILSFLLYEKLLKNDKNQDWLLLGFIIGLGMQSRITGLILPFFFLLCALWDRKFIKILPTLIIAFLIFLPYPIFTNLKFLREKSEVHLSRYIFDWSFFEFFSIPYLGLIGIFLFFSLTFIGILHLIEGKFLRYIIFSLLYIISLVYTSDHLYPRLYLPLLPFFAMGIFLTFEKVKKTGKIILNFLILFLFFYILLSIVNCIGIFFSIKTPDFLFSHAPYYLVAPENCTLLMKNWLYEFENVSSFIDLPKFDQPSHTTANYTLRFVANQSYNKIMWKGDDHFSLYLDNKFLGNYGGLELQTSETKINEGEHTIRIEVHNDINVGGIFQVMVCK
ncbi:MAG: glycosyltransferase family 39 protein, partial [Candidatus Aenigmatarchaeota archaeon]